MVESLSKTAAEAQGALGMVEDDVAAVEAAADTQNSPITVRIMDAEEVESAVLPAFNPGPFSGVDH